MQIHVAAVSLQSTIRSKNLSLADLPPFVSDLGFSGIEISDRVLGRVRKQDLREFKHQCEKNDCEIVIDANSDLTRSSAVLAQSEVDNLNTLIETACDLGCATVRITLGGQILSVQKLLDRTTSGKGRSDRRSSRILALLSSPSARRFGFMVRAFLSNYITLAPDKLQRASSSLRMILPGAEKKGVRLAIENHWGISSRPEWIIAILDSLDGCSGSIGTCPDFGNFPSRHDRYAGLSVLMSRALHVQAKCWRFGSDGEETSIDYGRCMEILDLAGYDDAISIEFEGGGNEIESCKKARELIDRCNKQVISQSHLRA